MDYKEVVINGIIETKNAKNDYGVFYKYMIRNYQKANEEYQTLDSFFNGCLSVFNEMIRNIEHQFYESQNQHYEFINDLEDYLNEKKYPDELHKEIKEAELNSAKKQLESLNYDRFSFSLYNYTSGKYRGNLKMEGIAYLMKITIELYKKLKEQTENPTPPEPQQPTKGNKKQGKPM